MLTYAWSFSDGSCYLAVIKASVLYTSSRARHYRGGKGARRKSGATHAAFVLLQFSWHARNEAKWPTTASSPGNLWIAMVNRARQPIVTCSFPPSGSAHLSVAAAPDQTCWWRAGVFARCTQRSLVHRSRWGRTERPKRNAFAVPPVEAWSRWHWKLTKTPRREAGAMKVFQCLLNVGGASFRPKPENCFRRC